MKIKAGEWNELKKLEKWNFLVKEVEITKTKWLYKKDKKNKSLPKGKTY